MRWSSALAIVCVVAGCDSSAPAPAATEPAASAKTEAEPPTTPPTVREAMPPDLPAGDDGAESEATPPDLDSAPAAQPWYCLCYTRVAEPANQRVTACRPTQEACWKLQERARKGSKGQDETREVGSSHGGFC